MQLSAGERDGSGEGKEEDLLQTPRRQLSTHNLIVFLMCMHGTLSACSVRPGLLTSPCKLQDRWEQSVLFTKRVSQIYKKSVPVDKNKLCAYEQKFNYVPLQKPVQKTPISEFPGLHSHIQTMHILFPVVMVLNSLLWQLVRCCTVHVWR